MKTHARKIVAWATIVMFLPTQAAYSLPTGEEVVSGTATFEHVGDNVLNITASDQSVINYTSFNIAQNEIVNFFLPAVDAFSLNRILDGSTSQILGSLTANGNLMLVNTSGFYFGQSASVNVGGIIASTHDIANTDFLAGNYVFEGLGDTVQESGTSILNEGSILAREGGLAVLVADAIENRGTVEAPLGTVALAAGDLVTVGISGDGVVSIGIQNETAHTILDKDGNPITQQIKNTGTLEAASGKVVLSAKSLDQVFESAINLEGIVRADTAVIGKDGVIEIISSNNINSTAVLSADQGSIHLEAAGDIVSMGTIKTKTFTEKGATFNVGGTYDVGTAHVENLDNAITLNTGSYSGETADVADIIVNDNATITLTADTTFRADSDTDGTGAFTMNTGSSIVGGGFGLTLYTSQASTLRAMSGLANFTLNASSGTPTYTANSNITSSSGTTTLASGVTLSTGTTTLTTNNLSVAGTLSAGSGIVDVDGNFDLTGSGTYTETSGTLRVAGNFTVPSGTNFNHSTGTVQLDGAAANIDVNSSETFYNLTFNPSTVGAAKTVADNDTLVVTNTLTLTEGNLNQATIPAAGTIDAQGGITHTATFDGGTGRINITGSGTRTITLVASGQLPAVTLNAANVTMNAPAAGTTIFDGNFIMQAGTFGTNTGTVEFDAGFTLSGGTFNAPTAMLVASDFTISGGTFNEGTGTVTLDTNSANIDVVTTETFNNLTLTGAVTKTVADNDTLVVNGTLTLTNGWLNQSVIPAAGTIDLPGAMTHGASYDGGTGRIDITGAGVRTINLAGGELPGLTLNAANVTMNGPAVGNTTTFDSAFILQAGTFTGDAGNITHSSSFTIQGGTYSAPSATLRVDGNFTISGGTFNEGTGTVAFRGAASNIDVVGTETFNNLTFSPSAGVSETIADNDTLVVTGTLTLTEGNINQSTIPAAGTIDAQGDVSHGSSFDGGTGRINITGVATRTINLTAAGQLPTVTLNAANVTMNGNASGTTTFDGAFTLQAGTFAGGAGTLDFNSSFTVSGGTFNAGTQMNVAGDFTISGGTFSEGTGTVTFDTNASNIDVNSSETFNNLTFNAVGLTKTVADNDTLVVTGTLTLTDGNINQSTIPAAGTIDAQGGVSHSGTFDGGTGRINITGVATRTINLINDGQLPAVTLNAANVTMNGNASGTTTTFDGTFTIQAGTFTGSTGTLNLNSGFSLSGGTFSQGSQNMDVFGDFSLSGGTFTKAAGGQILLLDGTGNLTDSNVTKQDLGAVTIGGTTTTRTLTTAVQVSSLTINSGNVFSLNGNNLTRTASGAVGNNGTFRLIGRETLTNITNLDTNSGTVEYVGDGDINIETWTIKDFGTGVDYFNLTINDTNTTKDIFDLSADLDIDQALSVSSGTFDAGIRTINLAGNFTVSNGTFTEGTSTLILDGSAVNLDVNSSETFYNLTLAGAAGTTKTVADNDTLVVTNTLLLGEGNINQSTIPAAGTIDAQGGISHTGGFDGGTGRINITGAGTRTVNLIAGGQLPAITLNAANVTINEAASGVTVMDGALTIQSGTWAGGAGSFTINSSFTLEGGTFSQGGGSGDFTVSGDFTLSGGTFTKASGGSTGVVLLTGTGNLTDSNVTKQDLGTVNINGTSTTRTATTGLKMTGLNIQSGNTFSLNGNNLTRTTSGAVSNLGTFRLQGGETLTNITNLDIDSGTVEYVGNGDGSSTTLNVKDFGSGADYYNLTINDTNPTKDSFALTTGLDVDGAFSLSSSSFSQGANTMNVAGNFTLASATTFTKASGGQALTFDGTGNLADSNGTLQDLGNVTVSAGTRTMTGAAKTTNLSVNAGATLTQGANALNVGGDFTLADTATFAKATGGQTLTFDGTGNLTDSNTTKQDLGAVTIGGTSTTRTLTTGIKMTNLTINGGNTFSLNGNAFEFTSAAAVTNNGVFRLTGAPSETFTNVNHLDIDSGTVEYVGDGDANAETFNIKDFGAGTDYFHLRINDTNGTPANRDTFRQTAALDVDGNLTLSSGTLNSNGNNINLAGDWTNNANYTSGANTVDLDGADQSILGSTTFNNLRKVVTVERTLTFDNAGTQTILGNLRLEGQNPDNRLLVRSNVPDSAWEIDPQGTRVMSFLNVRDSNNLNSGVIDCTNGCFNAGGNTRWNFVVAANPNNPPLANELINAATQVINTLTNTPVPLNNGGFALLVSADGGVIIAPLPAPGPAPAPAPAPAPSEAAPVPAESGPSQGSLPADGPSEGSGPEKGPEMGPSDGTSDPAGPESPNSSLDYHDNNPWKFLEGIDTKKFKTIVLVYEGAVYVQNFDVQGNVSAQGVFVKEQMKTEVLWEKPMEEPKQLVKFEFGKAGLMELALAFQQYVETQQVVRRMRKAG